MEAAGHMVTWNFNHTQRRAPPAPALRRQRSQKEHKQSTVSALAWLL